MGRDPDKPSVPPRPAPPTPAREGAVTPERARRSRRPDKGKPLPARSASGRKPGAPAPPAPESDIEETSVEADGVEWIVRLLGRARGGASASFTSAVPLLLLGFRPSGEEDAVEREALVVGRTLAALTPEQLEQALRRAAPGGPGGASATPPGSSRGHEGREG